MSLSPTAKKKVRESIATYCQQAVSNEPRIHYSQTRPFPFVDIIGHGWHTLDCSGFVINNYWNASHDTHVWLADPSGQKMSGNGNTWTMTSWLSTHGKKITTQPYLVGDIAMFDGHTMICHRKGDKLTSKWTSHGSEGGPVSKELGYRKDLVGVFRHPALL